MVVSKQTHLRVGVGRGSRFAYACGAERNAWGSMVLTSRANPLGVTCRNCVRTKAFAEAMKAAKWTRNGAGDG